MSLFHLDTELSCQANTRTALQQLNAFLKEDWQAPHTEIIKARVERIQAKHREYILGFTSKEVVPKDDTLITPHYAMSRLRSLLDGDCIILSEGISNFRPIADVLMCSKPGSYYTSGATALGKSQISSV
jgi:acetolactate synthase-1/2/3 large subunit